MKQIQAEHIIIYAYTHYIYDYYYLLLFYIYVYINYQKVYYIIIFNVSKFKKIPISSIHKLYVGYVYLYIIIKRKNI